MTVASNSITLTMCEQNKEAQQVKMSNIGLHQQHEPHQKPGMISDAPKGQT